MDDIPFYKRPWFYITSWLVFLLVVYFWQINRMGGIQANRNTVLQDLFCVFPVFFIIWMAFFSQFILPVNTFRDRQRIFDRHLRHLLGNHGPALFIENGQIKEHSGERLKRGPGVVWLDSASAAIIRTAISIRKTIGPGVHFTETNEYIEPTGTLDLHIQTQKIGLKDGENPFENKKEDQSKEQYDELQSRRKQVSALSRDGIELVPDISITFRVDTGFPSTGKPGSRFGYRTGPTKDDKELERQDQDIICRALLGEGINPSKDLESSLHRVAWNRLPGLMAVDVWRDYASKYTLDELFNPKEEETIAPLQPIQPTDEEIAPLYYPTQAGAYQKSKDSMGSRLLRDLNNLLERMINFLEYRDGSTSNEGSVTPPASPITPSPNPTNGTTKKTALQRINEMVKARLTQQFVDELDEYGKRTGRLVPSEEFKLLQSRGLRVLGVGVSNVRLHPTVQEQLIRSWAANWLKFAKDESDQLDLQRNLIETASQERVQCEYALLLSREIHANCQNGNRTIKGLLMSTLHRSRALIRSGEHSNSLRRRMFTELHDIEEMIKWMGDND